MCIHSASSIFVQYNSAISYSNRVFHETMKNGLDLAKGQTQNVGHLVVLSYYIPSTSLSITNKIWAVINRHPLCKVTYYILSTLISLMQPLFKLVALHYTKIPPPNRTNIPFSNCKHSYLQKSTIQSMTFPVMRSNA